jgi:hypothetical protein
MSIYYWLGVDWEGTNASSDYTDEAGRVLKYTIDRGRDAVIGSEGGGFEKQSPGKMILEVDNFDGRYDPWNSSGELYGKLMPGKRVRFITDSYSSTNADDQVVVTELIEASTSFGLVCFGDTKIPAYFGGIDPILPNNFSVGAFYDSGNKWYEYHRAFLDFPTAGVNDHPGQLTDATMWLTIKNNQTTGSTATSESYVKAYEFHWSEYSSDRLIYENAALLGTNPVNCFKPYGLTTDVPLESESLALNYISNVSNTEYFLFYGNGNSWDKEVEFYSSTSAYPPTLNLEYTISGMLFTGFITDIQCNGFRGTATITVEDGAAWLERRTPNIGLMTSTDAGGIISEILSQVSYPFSTNIEAGVDTIDYYWTNDRNALDEIHDLATSELGRFCVDANGTAHFINRHNSAAPQLSLTEDEIGRNIQLPVPWEYLRTIVEVNTYPRITGSTDSVIWTLRDAVKTTTDATSEIWADYNYDNEDVPALGVYLGTYKATADGTTDGTDKTADFDLDLTAFDRSAKIVITNNGDSSAYLVDLELKGTPITSPDPITVRQETTDAALPAEFIFDYPWLSSVNTAKDFLSVLYSHLSTAQVYPIITLYNRPETAFAIELEQKIHLVLDTYGINQDFIVSKITHSSGITTQEVITQLYLYPPIAGLSNADTQYFVWGSSDYGIWGTNKWGF